MLKMIKIIYIAVASCFIFYFSINTCAAKWVKGIYLTQSTLENTRSLQYLIKRSKQVGINTFVIDINHLTKAYKQNIPLVKANQLDYVARIVVFPGGGTNYQVLSEKYWLKKYRLAEDAIALGANAIQLDYIRYRSSQRASLQNAKNIARVIKWFKIRLDKHNIPLQIDVFGVASFEHAKYIGQDLKLFEPIVDAICPMLYPSHYEPYRQHARQPYFTVLHSLYALRKQIGPQITVKIYPFIELFNYRYYLSQGAKIDYIYRQIKGVQDGDADGWYAWSAKNQYNNLFYVLSNYRLN